MTGSHRLAVRTPGSHPGNRGSIPLGITKRDFSTFERSFFGGNVFAKRAYIFGSKLHASYIERYSLWEYHDLKLELKVKVCVIPLLGVGSVSN